MGNRLTQAKSVNGVQSSDAYLYNTANQLASVNGVNFTWDANGNLINDGSNTYTYDHADRLTAVQNQTTTIGNRYNGLGDRIQQSIDSATTNFTLDINLPLTQVLADGTNTYLYGLDRIAQSSLTTEYFLADALGSARQMTDAAGEVQSVASYEPFGAPITNGASSYGFAGEWQDPTGLVYLRARNYSPELGIFLSRDPFPGFLTQPASLTPYQYAFNNPVRYTDPSGKNPLLILGLFGLGGLLGGAIYGYGSQVARNLADKNCSFWEALTTNIDAGHIAFYTVAGGLLGLGIGGVVLGGQWLWGFLGLGSAAPSTINFLENQYIKVQHIMLEREGHVWSLIINPTGDILQDYRAIQPYLAQVMQTAGRFIRNTDIGPLIQFTSTINGHQIYVNAIRLANGTLQIVTAWIK